MFAVLYPVCIRIEKDTDTVLFHLDSLVLESKAIWEEGGQGSELLCIMQSTILSYPPSNDDADAYPYDTFQQMNEND